MLNEVELYKLIGERLASARKRKNSLTQDVIAERLGLTRTSISNIERGKQKAPLSLIYSYCFLLGKDISDILPSLDDVLDKKQTNTTAIYINGMKRIVPNKVAELISQIDKNNPEN